MQGRILWLLEQMSFSNIEKTFNTNFESSYYYKENYSLPKKKKMGNIIVFGSEASLQGAKQGSIYCASKFALRGFIQSLQEESRQSSVAISMINPGMVKTGFFDKLNFEPGGSSANYIEPEELAHCVLHILKAKNSCLYHELNIQPMKKVVVKNTKSKFITFFFLSLLQKCV